MPRGCRARQDRVRPAKAAQAQVGQDVADHGLRLKPGIDQARALDGTFGLGAALVTLAEENGAAQVAQFHVVQVGDHQMAHAKEGEVLDDFVAQRAGADDEPPRARQRLFKSAGEIALQTFTAVPKVDFMEMTVCRRAAL